MGRLGILVAAAGIGARLLAGEADAEPEKSSKVEQRSSGLEQEVRKRIGELRAEFKEAKTDLGFSFALDSYRRFDSGLDEENKIRSRYFLAKDVCDASALVSSSLLEHSTLVGKNPDGFSIGCALDEMSVELGLLGYVRQDEELLRRLDVMRRKIVLVKDSYKNAGQEHPSRVDELDKDVDSRIKEAAPVVKMLESIRKEYDKNANIFYGFADGKTEKMTNEDSLSRLTASLGLLNKVKEEDPIYFMEEFGRLIEAKNTVWSRIKKTNNSKEMKDFWQEYTPAAKRYNKLIGQYKFVKK